MAAIQKVVVPIYCTSFLAVEEEKQQKITRVNQAPAAQGALKRSLSNIHCLQLLQLWEKNSYFDEETIQQLQNPALGLGQYQVRDFLSWVKLKNEPTVIPVWPC